MEDKYILPTKELLSKSEELFDKDSDYFSLSKMIFKKDLSKKLTVPLGIDTSGEKYYIDMQSVPALLICGTTGSGKSVFLDNMIITLLLKNNPDELRFMFFDPKLIELGEYDGIPHLMVDTDKEYDTDKLNFISKLLKDRKRLLNDKTILEHNKNSETKLSQIFIIVDESIDVMKYEGINKIINEIIDNGVSLGVHLVLATNAYIQKDFSSRMINKFPYIISYDLTDKKQATYLNIEGSDLLEDKGTALVKCRNNELVKLQTPYISDKEINRVVDFIKTINKGGI